MNYQVAIRSLRLMVLAAGVGLIPTAACAQPNQLEVNVRSKVAAKPLGAENLQAAPNHGPIYVVLAVQLIPAKQPLIKPVDAAVLKGRVEDALNTQGFSRLVKGQIPEVLFTVQYGRAWLNNAYSGGFEDRAQRAAREKLIIKLIAWQYFSDPKARARQLWSTTIVVDNPGYCDLNNVAEEMLAAGAPYFGRELNEEGVSLFQPLPEGRAKAGNLGVVENSPRPK